MTNPNPLDPYAPTPFRTIEDEMKEIRDALDRMMEYDFAKQTEVHALWIEANEECDDGD